MLDKNIMEVGDCTLGVSHNKENGDINLKNSESDIVPYLTLNPDILQHSHYPGYVFKKLFFLN